MSGIEVVALVLGVFPLLISALEHHGLVNKARKRFGDFVEYQRTLRAVKHEQMMFISIFEQLLSPLRTDDDFDDGLESLLTALIGDSDDQNEVLDVARERLGRTFEHFMEISRDLHLSISLLLRALVDEKPRLQDRLRATHSPCNANSSAIRKLTAAAFRDSLSEKYQYRREQMKFGLGKSQRDELIKEVRQDREKLGELLDRSDKIANAHTSKTLAVSPRALKSLLQYSHHAEQTYTLLRQSWSCTCRDKHCVQLWLQHRTSTIFEIKILVIWAPNPHAELHLPPWDRQGLRVSLSRPEGQLNCKKEEIALPSASSKLATSDKEMTCKKRRVTFWENRVQESTPQAFALRPADASAANQVTGRWATSGVTQSVDITELCKAMSLCGMQATLLGLLPSSTGGRAYSVHSDPDQKIVGEGISLKEVLQDGCDFKPNRKVRFEVALAVASSHLQLCSTPWARKQWESSDILFPRSFGSNAVVMLDKPYVSADFKDDFHGPERIPKLTDRSFVCLGIMLLELLFGYSLEAHELWQQIGFVGQRKSTLQRTMIAAQWADSVEGQFGPDYSAAVKWCLNESPTTLEGDGWRRDLADKVVLPLQRCCEWIGARKAM